MTKVEMKAELKDGKPTGSIIIDKPRADPETLKAIVSFVRNLFLWV